MEIKSKEDLFTIIKTQGEEIESMKQMITDLSTNDKQEDKQEDKKEDNKEEEITEDEVDEIEKFISGD